jgi:hypothetical protein
MAAVNLIRTAPPCVFSLLESNYGLKMLKLRLKGLSRLLHVGTATKSVRQYRAQMARLGGASQGASDRASRQRPLDTLLREGRSCRGIVGTRTRLPAVCRHRRSRAGARGRGGLIARIACRRPLDSAAALRPFAGHWPPWRRPERMRGASSRVMYYPQVCTARSQLVSGLGHATPQLLQKST